MVDLLIVLVVYILRPFTLRLVLVVGAWCLWVVAISAGCCVVLFGLAEFAIVLLAVYAVYGFC